MNTPVQFNVVPTERADLLVVSGPTPLMHRAFSASPKQFAQSQVKGRRIYNQQLSPDGSSLTWSLNPRTVGLLHQLPRRARCVAGINGFIEQVVALSQEKYHTDDAFKLRRYGPSGYGEFSFAADIAKPERASADVTRLLGDTMVHAAQELQYPRAGKPCKDLRLLIEERVYYGKSGVLLPLGDEARVSADVDGQDWQAKRIELRGHNIEEGEALLIALMGSIAIARADTLA